MKKFFIIIVALVLLTLTGCSIFEYEEGDVLYKRFVVLESTSNSTDGTMLIVYDKETNVEYFMCYTLYKGFMNPIYNADGILKIYDENEED